MSPHRLLAWVLLFIGTGSLASPPELYHRPAYESPVRGAPDDLLQLAGYGFAADDVVVYGALVNTTQALAPPSQVPTHDDAQSGVAPIVSASDAPYSLTIKLPTEIRPDQSYALWVHTAHGEWSQAVKINDARPLWFTPAYVYSSGMPASLPREVKLVGRNLRPSAGHSTLVRFAGPSVFTVAVQPEDRSADSLNDQVARVPLPGHLPPGHYRIAANRDGSSWVDVADQLLDVLPDPAPRVTLPVSDPQFGDCRPDDGADDTACILRAIAAAARTKGGTVDFGPGTWDLIDGNQSGLVGYEGIVVPSGVQLHGAGSALTRISRHAQWNARVSTAAFTLLGHTLVTGFTFHDLKVYQPGDRAAPYLQVGANWQRMAAEHNTSGAAERVSDIVISGNVFDKPMVAIGSGGLPIDRLMITDNTFGAYSSALELDGDPYDMSHKFRIDDSIIDHNVFKPSSKLDLERKDGPIASEMGAGHRVDFSDNTADGASTDYLYAAGDPKGWRAAFFWSPNGSVEEVLVSRNTATCTGDKIGDGEAFAFDNNLNTFGFRTVPTVVLATSDSVAVMASLAQRQHNREVPADYYVDHWVQVVSGPGLGQVRRIVGYSTDAITHVTTLRVAPDWDVVPVKGSTRLAIGREYWQLYVLDNRVDNRQPLCQKSNRSRRVAGTLEMWGQSADSVFAGNRQYDSDGIFVQQNAAFVHLDFASAEHPCADCTALGFFNFFLELRDNLVDGEYDWANDCSSSGIRVGLAAAPWGDDGPPPTVSFGVSIAHNTIRHADDQAGGAVAQVSTWFAGPEPHRWPLSDGLLIHHNAIADIDGPRALANCEKTGHSRAGIAFPAVPISWHTVLYANTCKHVATKMSGGGVDTIRVCPSPASDSCECP